MAAEPIRIGTWDAQSDQSIAASNAVLKQAYRELKQPIEFVELPIRRAESMQEKMSASGEMKEIQKRALAGGPD